VVIDEETGVILDGYDLFYTLDLLSAAKISTVKIKLSNIGVRLLQHGLKSIIKENIIEAGIKGPKLPPKSFQHATPDVCLAQPQGSSARYKS